MFCSVIISTFNSPEWLEKVLWGYAAQTYTNFEIIVADDGSGPQTSELLARMRCQLGLDISQVWQVHRGFRKCRILNRAIAAAAGDYLVFTDGDCIPRRDFLAQHIRFARPNQFLSGGAVRLPRSLSQQISTADIAQGDIFRLATIVALGMRWTLPLRMLVTNPAGVWLLERMSFTRATFNGNNSSAWKEDVVRVNGFDEQMSYGGLDRELGERLVNAGVRPRSIRNRAACLHLDHARGYARPELAAANRKIREETRRRQLRWTPFGILKDREAPDEERRVTALDTTPSFLGGSAGSRANRVLSDPSCDISALWPRI